MAIAGFMLGGAVRVDWQLLRQAMRLLFDF